MDRLDLAGGLRRAAAVHRGAQQLVHPPVARALLEVRARRRQAGGLRHALHGAGHDDAGDGAVPALSHRDTSTARWWMARACICRTGRTRPPCRRYGAGRAHGSCPRRRLRRPLSIRTAKNLRNRLPLRTLTIAHPRHAMLEPLRDVIAEEVNVKEVVFADDPSAYGATEVLAVDPRLVGKRLGKAMKDVLAAAKAGDWHDGRRRRVEVAGQVLQAGEYELRFKPREGLDAVPFAGSAGVVVLDTKVDARTRGRRLARDFIRLVQVARKDAGFDVSDRIHIGHRPPATTSGPYSTPHQDLIKQRDAGTDAGLLAIPALARFPRRSSRTSRSASAWRAQAPSRNTLRPMPDMATRLS